MDIQQIKLVTDGWCSATQLAIAFETPGAAEVRALFEDTYAILKAYRDDKLVPKEVSGLLLEMQEFGRWVSELDETPLHAMYQEIVSLVCDINRYFLTGDADMRDIKTAIEKIAE